MLLEALRRNRIGIDALAVDAVVQEHPEGTFDRWCPAGECDHPDNGYGQVGGVAKLPVERHREGAHRNVDHGHLSLGIGPDERPVCLAQIRARPGSLMLRQLSTRDKTSQLYFLSVLP